MIRFIAAVDNKLGLANENGIPWQGLIPGDVAYFRDKTKGGTMLIGSGFYRELAKPLPDRKNIVASRREKALRPGFILFSDARKFLTESEDDIWVAGGADLFKSTIDVADELYLTRINKDFKCTKFFPAFKNKFKLARQEKPITENGISYQYEVWRKKG